MLWRWQCLVYLQSALQQSAKIHGYRMQQAESYMPVRSDQVVVDGKITAQIGIGHYAIWDPGKFVAVGFLTCWLVKQMACKWLYSLLKNLLMKTVMLYWTLWPVMEAASTIYSLKWNDSISNGVMSHPQEEEAGTVLLAVRLWWASNGVLRYAYWLGLRGNCHCRVVCLDTLETVICTLQQLFNDEVHRSSTWECTASQCWTVLSLPPCNPDLPPSQYHLFRTLKDHEDLVLQEWCVPEGCVYLVADCWNRLLLQWHIPTVSASTYLWIVLRFLWNTDRMSQGTNVTEEYLFFWHMLLCVTIIQVGVEPTDTFHYLWPFEMCQSAPHHPVQTSLLLGWKFIIQNYCLEELLSQPDMLLYF